MTASLDSAESQCIRSERHVTSCRAGQVELVVWLAQMVPAMPSILGDQSRIRTGRIWRWCRMAPPPRRVRANHCALRLCRSRLFAPPSVAKSRQVPAVRESPVGSARRSPTVEHHPVGDSVTAVARVVRAVEATPDFCGELSLRIGITGRKVSPCGRGDETGEADGFGIDRREQPGGAERRRLGARRDEDLGAAGPVAVHNDAVLPLLRPEVAADQEPGQHRIVGGGRTVAAQQPQVVSLRTDNIVEPAQAGGGLVDVRRPDPVAVAGADVAVVRQ